MHVNRAMPCSLGSKSSEVIIIISMNAIVVVSCMNELVAKKLHGYRKTDIDSISDIT